MTDFIRGPRSTDQAYLASTWVRSMGEIGHRKLGKRGGHIARHVDQVFDRGDTRALIRHRAGDTDAILGWVVYVDGPGVPVAHFVYVRRDERGKGIASALLRSIGILRDKPFVYTNIGPDARKLLTAYPFATHLPLESFLSPT